MAVAVCERLEEFGSLAVKATVLTPTCVEVAATLTGWLAADASVPEEELTVPSAALPLCTVALSV